MRLAGRHLPSTLERSLIRASDGTTIQRLLTRINMKQHEAVVEVMKENGGYATLSHLYKHVFARTNCNRNTKTPFASIRRIVQDGRFFYKIKPGLWALKSHRDAVTHRLFESENPSAKKVEEFDHSYYQGLLIELGNTGPTRLSSPIRIRTRGSFREVSGTLQPRKSFQRLHTTAWVIIP